MTGTCPARFLLQVMDVRLYPTEVVRCLCGDGAALGAVLLGDCCSRYCLDSAHVLTQAVLTLFPAPALQWTENLLDETLVLRGSQV